MAQDIKDFLSFKITQRLSITGTEHTEENVRAIMNDKELVKSFLREAIAAGL